MSTDIEDRLNEAAADNGMPWLREAASAIHDLREQVAEDRCTAHAAFLVQNGDCVICDLDSAEQDAADLRAERDALRKALGELVEHHDDYCADPNRDAVGEQPCPEATDEARGLLSPERSSSTAAPT